MEYKGITHIDQALTNIAIGYKNTELVADMVLPEVPVAKQSDKYFTFGKESFRIENDIKANHAPATIVKSFSTGTGSYYAEVHALADYVSEEDRANADAPINPDRETTEGLMDKLMLRKEKDIADAVFNTTTFTASTSALTGTDRWSDPTASDPLKNIKDASVAVRGKIGRTPNTLVLGQQVWDALTVHADIKGQFKYVERPILTPDMLISLVRPYGIDRVVIGSALYDTAKEGQTASLDYIWGKYAMICYVARKPELKTPSMGYCPAWKLYGTSTARVRKWFEAKNDADAIEVAKAYDTLITAASAGYLFSTVVD